MTRLVPLGSSFGGHTLAALNNSNPLKSFHSDDTVAVFQMKYRNQGRQIRGPSSFILSVSSRCLPWAPPAFTLPRRTTFCRWADT